MKIRKIIYSLILILIGIIELNAQIIVKENVHQSDILDRCEYSYSIKEIEPNESSKYVQQLTPLLDTLASNESAQMYIWDIMCKGDSIITCIQNWRFSFFLDVNNRKHIYGIVKYGKDNKNYFVRCYGKDTQKIMSKIFLNTDTLLTIEFQYHIIPPDEYIINQDISTRLMCNYRDCKLKDVKFIYNNIPIKWDVGLCKHQPGYD